MGRILALPDVRETLRGQGIEPVAGTPAEFGKLIGTEMVMWGEIVKRTGSRLD